MKAKFGAIVVAGSGKLGGHVFSKNRGGAFMRTKVTPANARTSFQTEVRARFTSLSQMWRALTQEQRDAWNAAVIDFARTDIFGDLRNPSGINLFQRLNNIIAIFDLAPILLPPVPGDTMPLVVGEFIYSVDTSALSIAFTGTMTDNDGILISATPPVSQGKSSVNSLFRLISVQPGIIVSPINISADYIAKFGSIGATDQKIFIRLQAVNMRTGQVGTPIVVSAIST